MYRRTISRRFTQTNMHFLLMNIKRCNPPPRPRRPSAPLTRVSKVLQEQARSKNESQAQASAFVVNYHLFTVLSLQCNV